jgi:multifunctional beta-oxidation protein
MNIFCNAICPVVASRMTETVMSPEELMNIRPELVTPFVAFLVHQSTNSETGSIFEIGGGHMGKLRWQRAGSLQSSNKTTLSVDELLLRWNDMNIFGHPRVLDGMHSVGPPVSPAGLRFDGRVVIVADVATPTGRHICKQFASLGAFIVINDTSDAGSTVAEIQHYGGRAIACQISSGKTDVLVETAVRTFDRIDILIDNGEHLIRRPFGELTESQWEETVHDKLRGNFQLLKSAYPCMTHQKYGRIINIIQSNVLQGDTGTSEQAAAVSSAGP